LEWLHYGAGGTYRRVGVAAASTGALSLVNSARAGRVAQGRVVNPPAEFHIPDERDEVRYADFVSIWHTADSFGFDFAMIPRRTARGTRSRKRTGLPKSWPT